MKMAAEAICQCGDESSGFCSRFVPDEAAGLAIHIEPPLLSVVSLSFISLLYFFWLIDRSLLGRFFDHAVLQC
jgi:hypothetical protein